MPPSSRHTSQVKAALSSPLLLRCSCDRCMPLPSRSGSVRLNLLSVRSLVSLQSRCHSNGGFCPFWMSAVGCLQMLWIDLLAEGGKEVRAMGCLCALARWAADERSDAAPVLTRVVLPTLSVCPLLLFAEPAHHDAATTGTQPIATATTAATAIDDEHAAAATTAAASSIRRLAVQRRPSFLRSAVRPLRLRIAPTLVAAQPRSVGGRGAEHTTSSIQTAGKCCRHL